jgi:uncharacterized membrane protein (UPF0182 family)
VEERPFLASNSLESADIEENQDILQNVRVWDPPVLAQAYAQLQAIRPYYEFPDVDVDRYEIDGQLRQVLLSARELSIDDLPEESRRWANQHLQYTHGYGMVASLANESTIAGQPSFLVKDVPGTVTPGAENLALDEPRVYYGEVFDSEQYSIVNSAQEEIDFPTTEGLERSSYAGEGGISVGNLFQRIAFAVREADPNLVLSSLIDADSRILIYRNVRDRVLRAAPFLSIDRDPYPAVVDGRTVWVLDAYTTSRWFPYSQLSSFTDTVPRENAAGENLDGVVSGDKNYIRNSVKVIVDAYDGTMAFHIIDDNDPLIEAWQGAFPDLFTEEELPDELQDHLRFPEDLFTIQSEVFLKYHVEDPSIFFAGEDEWNIANTPSRAVTTVTGTNAESTSDSGDPVTPTYLLFKLPGEDEQEFVLQRPFTPRTRNNMISMLIARSDQEHYGELMSLEFPRSVQVPGPIQVDNLINQDVEVSQTLTLLGQEGSDVSYGKQVILPLQDSLLYIQPLFVTAESVGIPELKKVAVVFGEEVVLADTLDEAITQLFDLVEPTPPEEPEEPEEPQEPGEPEEPQEPDRPGDARAEELLEQASRIYSQMQQALEDGDLERYAELEARLGRVLERAQDLSN